MKSGNTNRKKITKRALIIQSSFCVRKKRMFLVHKERVKLKILTFYVKHDIITLVLDF